MSGLGMAVFFLEWTDPGQTWCSDFFLIQIIATEVLHLEAGIEGGEGGALPYLFPLELHPLPQSWTEYH